MTARATEAGLGKLWGTGLSDPLPKFALSVPEAAVALGISERMLRRLLEKDPGLPRVHIGRRVVIPSRALEEWINRQAQEKRERVRGGVRALQGVRR